MDRPPSIPTIYHGVKYRSRLEARWAVFFDSLDIDHRFEAEGFNLDGSLYLIDFLIPQYRLWLEIKPIPPSPSEIEKCTRLAARTSDRVRLLYGEIGWWRWQGWTDPRAGGGLAFWREPEGDGWIAQVDETPALYCPCLCPECGCFGIEYRGDASRLPCGHSSRRMLTGDHKRIAVAVEAAKSFQFDRDHGPAGVARGA